MRKFLETRSVGVSKEMHSHRICHHDELVIRPRTSTWPGLRKEEALSCH